MYGFGDDQNPYTESVDLLEDLVIEYISEMVSTHCQRSNAVIVMIDSCTVQIYQSSHSLFRAM